MKKMRGMETSNSSEPQESLLTSEKKFFTAIKSNLLKKGGKIISCDELLQNAYQRFPSNTALISDETSLSYKELYFRSILLAQKLASLGIKSGNHVLIYCENSLEFYVSYFAIWQLGGVTVPVNTFLHEKELAHIINDCSPKIIITSTTLKSTLDKLITGDFLEVIPPLVSTNDFDWLTPVPENFTSYGTTPQPRDENDLAVLLYTSGTTGRPKGVMLSSKNVITNILQDYARFKSYGLTDNERFFCVLPLFHVFAQNTCLWLPLLTGASVIIVKKIDRRLILKGLALKPTIFFGFPALYGLLCMMKNAPLESIKLFVSGADALPDKIRLGFAIIYGRRICAGYGLSEASPVVAVNHENEQEPTDVVGYPFVGIECDIRNEQGESLPRGQIGNLWLKGDNIMLGYYKDLHTTRKILVDGWLDTGDRALIDKHGKLAIRGREKDVIIHKGFNIYPAEIENTLMSHPAIFKAAVIGKHDDASGQIPVAYVAARKLDPNLEKELLAYCSNHLAGYKIPRKIICLEDLPMNATGKTDKKQLTQNQTI